MEKPERAWRLDQLMLLGTVILVTILVGLSGVLQALGSRKEFDESATQERAHWQEQARHVAQSAAQLLSVTSAAALRDNDFAFISNLTQSLVTRDPNVTHIRVTDAQKHVVADSPASKEETKTLPADGSVETTFNGLPVERFSMPVAGANGQPLGFVLVDYSLKPLHEELARVDRARVDSMRRIRVRTLVLGFGFVLFGMIIAALQSRRITQPLAALTAEALRLANGELDARVKKTKQAGAEVLTLGTVFNHMADQIKLLLERTRESAKIEHDLEIARAVQETFMPGKDTINVGGTRLAGSVTAADQCGGDWWGWTQLDDRRIAICTGDVTGHGVSTALVAAAACSSFLASTSKDGSAIKRGTPAILEEINRTLCSMCRGKYHMSCVAGILDVHSGLLEVARAAHPFPIVMNRHTRDHSSIMPWGPHLGETVEARFESEKVQLKPGDLVLWFSDGVVEADGGKAAYGAKRLRDTVGKFAHLSIDALRDAVLSDVLRFTSGARADDMTLIITEFEPVAQRGSATGRA